MPIAEAVLPSLAPPASPIRMSGADAATKLLNAIISDVKVTIGALSVGEKPAMQTYVEKEVRGFLRKLG